MVKRLIKLILSSFYFLYLKFNDILRRNIKKVFLILYYHSVSSSEMNNFIKQLVYLKNRFNIIKLIDFNNIKKDSINVSITFDDGLLSVLQNAQPELVKRKIPFTVFVPSGYLGKVPDWDIDSIKKSVTEPVMTLEQLNQLNKEYCTIGSHTVNHKILTSLSLDEAKTELQSSKEELEKLLNTKIELFSFPYGAYNLKLIQLAKETGYKGLYTINTSFASTDETAYLFGRIAVSPTDWLFELFLKINGGYNWIGWLQKRKYLKKH